MKKYIDSITEQRIATLHPAIREEALNIILDINGHKLLGPSRTRVTCALRSPKEQNLLYAQRSYFSTVK